jgi:hypothetical protein
MYAISANHDWRVPKPHLISLVKSEEFLDAAVKDEAEELSANVLKVYAKHIGEVEKEIMRAFKDSEFYTSHVDGGCR